MTYQPTTLMNKRNDALGVYREMLAGLYNTKNIEEERLDFLKAYYRMRLINEIEKFVFHNRLK